MEDETCDIINKMFASNLDEILQTVFFFLDPVSLKDARCVCHQWNQFIKNRLWRSKVAREKLNLRLYYRWRNESNVKIKQLTNIKMRVYSLICDDKFVYCGIMGGFIKVYCLSNGQLFHELDLNYENRKINGYCDLEFDVGESVIAAMGYNNVCVWDWDKKKGDLLYTAKHNCLKTSHHVFGIKVISRMAILTGGSDGGLALFIASQKGEWSLVKKYTDLTERVIHIDSDEDYVVTGTRSAVHLWKFANDSIVLDPRSIEVEVQRLTFSYPFIFVLDGNWQTLQVWNLNCKEIVRDIDLDQRRFENIRSNDRFLTISQMDHYLDDDKGDLFVFIFDKKQLCDPKISDDKLWRKAHNSGPIRPIGPIAAINTTTLVVSDSNFITIQNFWDSPK